MKSFQDGGDLFTESRHPHEQFLTVEGPQGSFGESKEKADLLARISHEIRTPLNAIIGMTELLNTAELKSHEQRYLEVAQRASHGLLEFINDLIDFSRLESGEVDVHSEVFDIYRLVEDNVELMDAHCDQKGLDLSLKIDAEVPQMVFGDSRRIRQILTNLISNAIKFTDSGGVNIRVRRLGSTDSTTTISIDVEDTGVGIGEEQLHSIFTKFQVADGTLTRRYGGMGLGLTVANRLSRALGGRIIARSARGHGSQFSLVLPLESRDFPTASTIRPVSSDLSSKRILVYLSDEADRWLVCETLRALNARVHTVDNWRDTVDLVKVRADRSEEFDLIIIGEAGNLSAQEFCRHLRLRTHSKTPVVAVYNLGEKILNDNSLIGLPRPLTRVDIISRVGQAFSQLLQVEVVKPSEKPDLKLPEMRILLAEDSQDNRDLVAAFLKDSPVTLDFAENGYVAFQKAVANDYDVVLMDIQMPVMDGYTATNLLCKEFQRTKKDVPIVALTAHAFKRDLQRCLDVGCKSTLTKPVTKQVLLDALLCAFQGQKYDSNQSLIPNENVVKEPAKAGLGGTKMFEEVDDDLADLVPNFLSNRRKDVALIDESLSRRDFTTIARIGHTMKGNSRPYGFPALEGLGKRLEAAAKEDNEEKVTTLRNELDNFLSTHGF